VYRLQFLAAAGARLRLLPRPGPCAPSGGPGGHTGRPASRPRCFRPGRRTGKDLGRAASTARARLTAGPDGAPCTGRGRRAHRSVRRSYGIRRIEARRLPSRRGNRV